MAGESFYDVVDAAVRDLAEHGYDSAERVAMWQQRIREAAEASMTPQHVMEQALRETLADIYRREIERGGVLKRHQGVPRFTLEKVKPRLRAELDRRILASADLIRLNREQAIDQTLRRFAGWATSIPAGGGEAEATEARRSIKKSLKALPFEQRRVLIDQGHKLNASLSETLARDGHAIAALWRSHWRQPGYNYRPDHKERDQVIYLLKSSWATEKGLVKRAGADYYDDITAAGQEPFCRCWIVWLYNLRQLPDEMLTAKGKDALAEAKLLVAAPA